MKRIIVALMLVINFCNGFEVSMQLFGRIDVSGVGKHCVDRGKNCETIKDLIEFALWDKRDFILAEVKYSDGCVDRFAYYDVLELTEKTKYNFLFAETDLVKIGKALNKNIKSITYCKLDLQNKTTSTFSFDIAQFELIGFDSNFRLNKNNEFQQMLINVMSEQDVCNLLNYANSLKDSDNLKRQRLLTIMAENTCKRLSTFISYAKNKQRTKLVIVKE